MYKIFFILFFTLTISTVAQSYFNRRYDVASSYDKGTSIIQSANNLLIFGYSVDSVNSAKANLSVVKTDSSGNVVLKKKILNPSWLPSGCRFVKALANKNNCYVSLGTVNTVTSGPPYYITALFKLNSNFDTLWVKKYYSANSLVAGDMCLTDENGFFIYGSEAIGGGPVNYLFVIKTDSLGNILWKKNYGSSSNINGAGFIFSTGDGNSIIGFSETLYAAGTHPTFPKVIKLDSSGNYKWSFTPAMYYTTWPQGIIATRDKGYVIIGATTQLGNVYPNNPMEIKIDSGGIFQWSKQYSTNGDGYFISGTEMADSSLFLAGVHYNIYTQLYEGLLAKTGKLGDSLWFKTINFSAALNCYLTDMLTCPGGKYVLSGYLDTLSGIYPPYRGTDFWVLKTDSVGCDSNCFTAIVATNLKNEEVAIYPNPANSKVNVELNVAEHETKRIRIRDYMGQIVWSGDLAAHQKYFEIDIFIFPCGFYSMEVCLQRGVIVRQLIIQR